MDERNDVDKIDEVLLPGFRFHPTDEELVGFYLKRKIQQKSLLIELIKQVDIYKYDPWDLPKLAITGEKEWYFYCPRDRKYRNSARPNRVTAAGFWKATGTDRPIYSSDGTKCIGLKKSLVFYRGRAAKGIKTDWMMHEFRLPSLLDTAPQKKILEKIIPPNDAWAICRIFKKTNSTAQRAMSHSWVSTLTESTAASDIFSHGAICTRFSSENVSCTTEIGSVIQLCGNNNFQQSSTTNFSTFDIPSYNDPNPNFYKPSLLPPSNGEELPNILSPPLEISVPGNLFGDIEGPQQQSSRDISISLPQEMQVNMTVEEDATEGSRTTSNGLSWGTMRSIGFPFNLQLNFPDAGKTNFSWDSPPCPSEMSTTYSRNNCYT